MGAFGAVTLAMKHPDVFSAVYALSPCCLGMEWRHACSSSSPTSWSSQLRSELGRGFTCMDKGGTPGSRLSLR